MDVSSRARLLLATVAILLPLAACGSPERSSSSTTIDVSIPTTSAVTPCEQVAGAERAVTDASLTATGSDEAARAAVREAIVRLRTWLPEPLRPNANALQHAFDEAWAGRTDPDPFETDAYRRADQAIRREVASHCPTPSTVPIPTGPDSSATLPTLPG